jgi:competence protein ComEA
MTRDQQGVVLALGLFLILAFLLTSAPFPSPSGHTRDSTPPAPAPTAGGEVWVEVDGGVRNPGIYPLDKGKTFRDAVEKAGGAAGNAGISPESSAAPITKSGLLKVGGGGQGTGPISLQSFDPPKIRVLAIPININTAKAEELDILPGVGPKMAQAIVAFREAHGRFSTLEDLQKVRGLGPKKIAALRPHITLAD